MSDDGHFTPGPLNVRTTDVLTNNLVQHRALVLHLKQNDLPEIPQLRINVKHIHIEVSYLHHSNSFLEAPRWVVPIPL